MNVVDDSWLLMIDDSWMYEVILIENVCIIAICFILLVGGGDETRDVPSYREPENSHIPSK